MMMGLKPGVPAGAENGIWALLAFLNDVEGVKARLAELTEKTEALEKAKAQHDAAKTAADEALSASTAAAAEAIQAQARADAARGGLDSERARMAAGFDAERNRLDRIADQQAQKERDLKAWGDRIEAEKAALEINRNGHTDRARALDAQERDIQGRLAAAQVAKTEAEDLRQQYQRKLAALSQAEAG